MSGAGGALSGADVVLEGLHPAPELPRACALGPGHFSRAGHRPHLGRDRLNRTWRSAGLFLANSVKFFQSVPSI